MGTKIENNIEEQKRWNDLSMWTDGGHEWSEGFGGTDKMWKNFLFPRLKPYLYIDKKMIETILEIAPGQGRVTDYLLHFATKKISIVDMNENLIDVCKEKFKNYSNIEYYTNDGLSLDFIEDDSIDLVFSWDSFVHMHQEVVENYIKQIATKLKKGGVGFIHHSNLGGGDDLSFNNVCGRANNSPQLFAENCEKYGLEIINQEYVTWNDVFDVISIFKK